MYPQTRREFLKNVGAGIAWAALSGCVSMGQASSTLRKRPNILFIFADDQCFETLRSLGHDEIQTPNLDKLVRGGVTFTHTYNQGAWHGAVCVASRTMLNIGRFLWHAKNAEPNLNDEAAKGRFWSQYMKKAGYDTYMTGKWHVKIDPKKIFDNVTNKRPGMPNQTKQGYNRPIEGKKDVWSPYDTKFGGYWKGGKHWSEVLGDDAEGFLAKAAKSDNPFFMYLAFNAPHDPRQSPKEYVDKYPLDKVKVPVNYQDEYEYKDEIGCGKNLRDEKLGPFPRTKYAVKVHRQEYYAIITHMDAQVGRILDALEKTGRADNTYIFFTADHGLAVGHHGLFGKQNMFDHSVRVPLMVTGPNVPKNKTIDSPVYLQDIMATSLDLAGVEMPAQIQFKSLLPLIEAKRKQSYNAIYGGYINLQRMITMDGYKMIYYPKIDKTLLYDLKSDPMEMKNIADDPANAGIIKKLKKRLKQLQRETGDTLSISN